MFDCGNRRSSSALFVRGAPPSDRVLSTLCRALRTPQQYVTRMGSDAGQHRLVVLNSRNDAVANVYISRCRWSSSADGCLCFAGKLYTGTRYASFPACSIHCTAIILMGSQPPSLRATRKLNWRHSCAISLSNDTSKHLLRRRLRTRIFQSIPSTTRAEPRIGCFVPSPKVR